MLAPIIEKQCFRAALTFIIAGPGADWIDVAPSTLRSVGEHLDRHKLPMSRLEEFSLSPALPARAVDGTMHAGLCSLYRVPLVVRGRSRTRKVVDFINLDVERERHIVPCQIEVLVIQEMLDVRPRASEKVIDAKGYRHPAQEAVRKGVSLMLVLV